MSEIGCDLLTGTGRKFLRGPRGTGFLYVRTGGAGPAGAGRGRDRLGDLGRRAAASRWADGAQRFETWERSGVNIVGFGAAVEQALELGLDEIGERAIALGARLRDQLAALPKVRATTRAATRCAIVTAPWTACGRGRGRGAGRGRRQRHARPSRTTTRWTPRSAGVHPLVRLSPHYYNTEAELDRAAGVIADL